MNYLDTHNVTNMEYMFYSFGNTNMKSFYLGNNFYTDKVTNTTSMFAYVLDNGAKLDLGPHFTMKNVYYKDCQDMFLRSNWDKLNVYVPQDFVTSTAMSTRGCYFYIRQETTEE